MTYIDANRTAALTLSPLIFFTFLAATPRSRRCPTRSAAFARVLERRPAILAVGEYHELEGGPKVKSAVSDSPTELLPLLKGRAGDARARDVDHHRQCGEVESRPPPPSRRRPGGRDHRGRARPCCSIGRSSSACSTTSWRSPATSTARCSTTAASSTQKRAHPGAAEARSEGPRGPREGQGGTPERVRCCCTAARANDLTPAAAASKRSLRPPLRSATDGGYLELDLLASRVRGRDEDELQQGRMVRLRDEARCIGQGGARLNRCRHAGHRLSPLETRRRAASRDREWRSMPSAASSSVGPAVLPQPHHGTADVAVAHRRRSQPSHPPGGSRPPTRGSPVPHPPACAEPHREHLAPASGTPGQPKSDAAQRSGPHQLGAERPAAAAVERHAHRLHFDLDLQRAADRQLRQGSRAQLHLRRRSEASGLSRGPAV